MLPGTGAHAETHRPGAGRPGRRHPGGRADELQNTSGKTDSVYARLETQLRAAQRLDPNNAAIGSELAAFGKQRAGLQAAAAERLKTAKFPAHAGNFTGPGDPKALTAAAIRYFNEVYPKEKAIAASVAGNWVSTKKNLLGQTIQWGLPVYVASIQNNSKEICRVFKMTVRVGGDNRPRRHRLWTTGRATPTRCSSRTCRKFDRGGPDQNS